MIFLLIIYFIFLIFFAVYSIVGIYHLWRFGYVGDLTKPFIFAYILISVIIVVITLIFILTRQWPIGLSI
ncbi:hypothetical protein A2215_00015 [Candidatus Berkelbacteria bacterium RIFOXYA2_FULL_43_10]|uniref:Uncharacterized protein n=1 Tax=Candidatus Berkelbacteria bacterium RIFOXYA2_FULL_43_10 TaxID=1797472 RepID=A0A1F5E8W4_9BACT|nr:MAG: hypothetical protein A2215_00015 [Candidatus Berkelbacteria bacterium RIFOXYA2_FULL_43_10]